MRAARPAAVIKHAPRRSASMAGFLFGFFLGGLTGVYVAQSYHVSAVQHSPEGCSRPPRPRAGAEQLPNIVNQVNMWSQRLHDLDAKLRKDGGAGAK
jgi:hypothetical protein